MDTIQKCAIAIKNEIDSMLEDIVTETDTSRNLFDNEQITCKEEIRQPAENNHADAKKASCAVNQDLLIENSSSASVVENYIDPNIKNEDDLVSYDYPNFDDGDTYCDDETTANQEKEEQHIKIEIEEALQKAHYQNAVLPDANDCNEIVPDIVEPASKYSFVMKIPDVMSNMDNIVPTCLLNGSYNDTTDELGPNDPGGEIVTNDIVPNSDPEPFDATQNVPLLQEYSTSEPCEMFQLNSITGNELSLEQQAYGAIKTKQYKYLCPMCPKAFTRKSGLTRHLNIHKTIENYKNGRIKRQRTLKLNFRKKQKTKTKPETKTETKPEVQNHNNCVETEETSATRSELQEAYKCTCGKAYKRRTRMESCLRSHESCESDQSRYKCMSCAKQCKSKEELALHRKRLHRNKFPCKFCPTNYNSRRKLYRHLQIHQKVQMTEYKVIQELVKGKKKLQCIICSKFCQDITELKMHVMTEHKGGPFVCPHCKNSFPKITEFGNHIKAYHQKVEKQSVLDVLVAFSKLIQAWKCEECDMQFLEADKFALHQIEKHSPDQKVDTQFQCPDCRRVFVSQKGLKSHRRIHEVEVVEKTKTEDMGVLCLECRMICKDMQALTSHMRYHSVDRKYVCKFCDYRFATIEKRRAHVEIHTGDMKFVCFICEYQCTSLNRLNKHKNSIKHLNMKEYLLTGKPLIEESTSKDNSKKEAKSVSAKKRKKNVENNKSDKESENSDSSDGEEGAPVCCDVCGEKFLSESEMLNHKQTHPFIEFPNDDKPTRIFFK